MAGNFTGASWRLFFAAATTVIATAVTAGSISAWGQTLSPATSSFGNWAVQSTSTAQTVTLNNNQTVALSINSISVSGDFASTSTCPISPSTLPASAMCKISITFKPTALGTRTGTLTVKDNAAHSPQTAQLTGNGIVAAALSLSALGFGGEVVNTTSAAKVITLQNNQTVPLKITGIAVSGDYAETSNCPLSPNTLAGKGTCNISVTFTPTVTGSRTGTLTVSDNASNSPQTAQLTGNGLTATTLSAVSLGFAVQSVNTTSPAQLLTLQNNQTIPLSIAAISTTGDFAQTSNCPLSPTTLGAQASCSISVTFTPTAAGSRTGVLTVKDNANNSPQTASLSGTGIIPAALSSSALAFGNQPVNAISAAKVVTLQNSLSVPLTIASISTSGDFAQTSNCPLSPGTLAAKGSCSISVTFTPTALGSRAGTLTVQDNASNSPQTAQLTGSGTAPVTLSTTSLTFSSQGIGTTSNAKSLTLKNNQSIPLSIASVSATGPFAQTSTCPLSPNTLAAGTSCSISVTFTPTALSTQTGNLNVSYNSLGSPQTVSLSGTGTLAGLLSITVAPPNPTIAAGNQQQLSATGNWNGGIQIDISSLVSWTSSATAVVSVSSSGLAQAIAQGTATITATYGSVSGTTKVTAGAPALTSISVVPNTASLAVGAYQQFSAVMKYSDGSSKNTTSLVTWSSSSGTIAPVNSAGLASIAAPGTATITATAQSITGSATVSAFQPACVSAPPGMIGWWTGDGNTVDIAGSNSGTLQNGAAYGGGEVGQGFSFNGSGASVLINSTVYSPGAGTLMFWFLPKGAGWLTGSLNGAARAPGLAVDASGNVTWEFANLTSQALGQVSLNQWSYIAFTWSTSNSQDAVNVYLNGALAASAVASQNSSWYPQLAFGGYLGAQRPYFTGVMDEIAIFNQALSAADIAQVYDAFSGGMCKPTLQSIAVTPANASVATGLSQSFNAAGSYSDGSSHNLTTSASWHSSSPAVATVNGSGQASALAVGNSTIAATLAGKTGSTNFNVVAGLVSIQVNPPNPAIAAGTHQQFTAQGTFSDGSTKDLTASANWTSSTSSAATIASGGLASAVATGQTMIAATVGSVSGSTLLTVTPAVLSALTVTPSNPSIVAGTTQTFTAMGLFSDGSTQNLTNSVIWSSSMPSVATINTGGVAAGLAAGQSLITATSGAISNSALLTVSAALLTGITVTPANPLLSLGSTQQFTATGTYSDGSTQDLTDTASWISSNSNVASLGATGLASALAVGSTSVSASFQSLTGSTTLTVATAGPALQSISVTPVTPAIAIGQNQQFTAVGTYSDGSTQDLSAAVTWSSTQPAVAAISASGLASALSGGSTTISAALGNISAGATLTVNPVALLSIAVTPPNAFIALGTNQQFAAVGTYADGSTLDLTTSATWSSSIPTVAAVNGNGLSTSSSTGQTSVIAVAAGITGSSLLSVTPAALVSIAITPSVPAIPLGTTKQFAATGTFTDNSSQDITSLVQWGSSDSTVATISNAPGSQGLSTSVATGGCVISATAGSVSSSTTLTISVAALASITVNPPGPSIALGTTQQFTATGLFTDSSTQDLTASATWQSGNTGVASIGPGALATSLSVGTSAITASLGSVGGSTQLTVTPAVVVSIAVNPSMAAIPLGSSQSFSALGTFSDNSTQDVTNSAHWSSSVPGVATVSNTAGSNGTASATGSGGTIIAATLGSVTGSASLTVTSPVLVAIEISPQNPSISIGSSQQFSATGIYSDGSTATLTASSLWASSSAAVATVGNSAGSQGLAVSAGLGTTNISASYGTLTASTSLAVQDVMVSISVGPQNDTIAVGAQQQFTATANFASGATGDVTGSVIWSSASPSVATINATGLAVGVAVGQSVISATLGTFTASSTLSVSGLVSPTDFRVDISVGTTGQLFVSWDTMSGASYYNLQRSTAPNSGFSLVAACSGLANLKNTSTIASGSMRACRDGGLTVGTSYYYQVQACYSNGCSPFTAVASNVPVTSNCTPAQIPSTAGIKTLPNVSVVSSVVDPAIQFLPNNYQYAFYPSVGVARRNQLVVNLPGSNGSCGGGSAFTTTAQQLGFDVICVNYSNLSSQQNICIGDTNCFGYVSQAKEDATGVCSVPGQSQCGKDPATGQPYYLSNPADAITQRISMMLQYLNNHGYNQNGTNWGSYLSGTTPLWTSIIMSGFSQGGDMSTFTAYEKPVVRAVNLSAPPQGTKINGIEVGASYFTNPSVTNIRNIYGLVSVDDERYQEGIYAAVWQVLGFTALNNDAEVQLNTGTPIGLNCNSGIPSHNFSTSAPPGPDGDGHNAPLFLWNEDVFKFMLLD